jgi:hypothetical protein
MIKRKDCQMGLKISNHTEDIPKTKENESKQVIQVPVSANRKEGKKERREGETDDKITYAMQTLKES